jgi:DNA polymerase-2
VEVKGMEAVRSDTTALARRLQLELLELVFAGRESSQTAVTGCTEEEYRQRVAQTVLELRSGKLDHELVYRKRLTRFPETYTSSTPPQVKAARALGWKKKRGTVEYLWTVNGPEPAALAHGKLNYDHYVESQVYPLVRSIAAAAKWDAGFFVTRKDSGAQMQMELVF